GDWDEVVTTQPYRKVRLDRLLPRASRADPSGSGSSSFQGDRRTLKSPPTPSFNGSDSNQYAEGPCSHGTPKRRRDAPVPATLLRLTIAPTMARAPSEHQRRGRLAQLVRALP